MGSESEVSVSKVKRTSKPKVRTGCITCNCDLLRGLQSSAPPVFEVSSKWINRIESKAAASKSNLTTRPSIGARFFVSPWSQDIPSPLSSILYSLCHLISRFEDIEDSDCRSLPLENDHLVLLANRLHSLPREITLTPFQDAIRLGTLCYLTVRVMRFEGNPCIENLIRTLRHNFEYSLPILSAVAPDLLFWILFISGIASQGFDSHIWCIENLRNCASQLGLRWWEDAASILEGYFFVSRLRNDPAKALWNSVVGGMTFVKQEQPML
ncbi:hypothetical protein N7450_003492 [Penicillium hetheringtonii]|uniref:Uncharacterized protein n=1 Tax=Penicillium hetheringtonii TaxID=911720 RepID=A0AAD6DZF0_9EURO|nr:hypothetical protein N7450_003492 [Penicillium hetheringtonii]